MDDQRGKLIIACEGVIPQNPPQEGWWQQVESLQERIAPFVPIATQGVILSSTELPAITMADYLFEVSDLPVRTQDELAVSSDRKRSRKKVLASVMSALERYQLVVVVSHESACRKLATDAVKWLTGEKATVAPTFGQASAVMIHPDRPLRRDGTWSYL